ncbi:hypothetical protein ACFLQN_00960 [Candidatus Aenigmatarchaeota archaeon]
MPCKKCKLPLYILDDQEVCVKCENINFLPKEEAELISDFKVRKINLLFSRYISRINKYKLIVHLMGYREKIASDFFQVIPKIDIYNMLASNILIKRVMKDGNPEGSQDLGIPVEKFVETFSNLIKIAEENVYISEGIATYKFDRHVPFVNLASSDISKNYKIIYREEWKYIVKSYETELIMNKGSAKKYLRKHKAEYDKALKTKPTVIKYSKENFIEMAFPAINTLNASFQKNVIFSKIFNFDYLKKSGLALDHIMDILGFFPLTGNSKLAIVSEIDDFYKRVSMSGIDLEKVKNNLLMGDENHNIFPYFVKVCVDDKEMVIITPNFYRILFIFLHAIIHKDILNNIRSKKGKLFENHAVKKEFEENGFEYIPNIQDNPKKPSLEIDGVAYNDDVVYVCEVKNWKIKPFFEQLRVHNHILRDLKGVVEGKEYTTKDGVLIAKKRPSLLKKIEYIKNNMKKHEIKCKDQRIEGLVITSLNPLMKDYKDVKFISIDEIKNLQ